MPIKAAGSPEAAMFHAIQEAAACVHARTFCAALAMLRTAMDVWAETVRPGDVSNSDWKEARLAARLKMLAERNEIYRAKLHKIVDAIRDDAGAALHRGFVCSHRSTSIYELTSDEEDLRSSWDTVADFIATAVPEIAENISIERRRGPLK